MPALRGNRRKANCVIGRDNITLDLDNIPAGGIIDVVRRLEGLSQVRLRNIQHKKA
ncbi:hypothetical protein KHA80_14250 [Anaerobacillus sp. HL2]|nr:hypothetical protein KHA80_14250 [Anaerobacillus sp. HL2]